MFVRWQKRQRVKRQWDDRGDTFTAVLVESYRDAEGRPRQRHIAYLGSIREHTSPGRVLDFWNHADTTLKRLVTEGKAVDIEAVTAALQIRVPHPRRHG